MSDWDEKHFQEKFLGKPASPAPVGNGEKRQLCADDQPCLRGCEINQTCARVADGEIALGGEPAPVGDGLVTVPKLLVEALRKWMQMQSRDNTAELYNQAHKFFKLPWVDPDE